MDAVEDPELVTVAKVAELIKSSERHVWRLISRGELSTFRDGRITRVLKASVRDYVDRHLEKKTGQALLSAVNEIRSSTDAVTQKPRSPLCSNARRSE